MTTHNSAILEAGARRYDNDDNHNDGDGVDGATATWKSRAAVALLGLFGVSSLRRTRAHVADYDVDSDETQAGDDADNNNGDDDSGDDQIMSRRPLVDAHRDRRADRTAKRIERNRRALRDCGLD